MMLRLLLILIVVTLVYGSFAPKFPNRLWGTNIHYTNGRPGESLQLSKSYKIARMDFAWGGIERVKGQYDFSAFENLWTELHQNPTPVACYWILDYGNPLYDGGKPPTTEEGIQAFVNFILAGITHFKGRNIVWEMWNEPNGGFWPPAANSTAYSILANAVGAAIRGDVTIQDEIYIGPATSGVDLNFLEATFKAGVLRYFDAVSVHPYRGGGPETVLSEYAAVRALIQKYAPGKDIPIISGEWGWSTCLPPCTPGWPSIISEDLQAKYLVRQWLTNAFANVPISIYYDFLDDGPNPTYREDNFGTVHNAYQNESVPFIPKPAYNAAFVAQQYLSNLDYQVRVDRIPVDDGTYIFAFGSSSNKDQFYTLWKTSGAPIGDCSAVVSPNDCGFYGITKDQCEQRGCCFKIPPPTDGPQCYYHSSNTTDTVVFKPVQAGCFEVIDLFGIQIQAKICSDPVKGTITITGSDTPIYFRKL